MRFTGGPENNNVSVSWAGEGIRLITDTTHDISAVSPCVRTGVGGARCPFVTSTILDLGAGNDTVHGGEDPDIINGSAGNGTTSTVVPRTTTCEVAQATTCSTARTATTSSRAALQTRWSPLEGVDGNDYLSGGNGQDRVTYLMKRSGTSLTLDGFANDGLPGCRSRQSRATSIEDVTGSHHDDFIAGNAFANRLFGVGGDDTMYGREADDFLIGEGGADSLWGESGNDTLHLRDVYVERGTSTVARTATGRTSTS